MGKIVGLRELKEVKTLNMFHLGINGNVYLEELLIKIEFLFEIALKDKVDLDARWPNAE